jgi:hypothetical protein
MKDLVGLLRREGLHSGVWFSEHLLKAAAELERQAALIEELTDELEGELNARYAGMLDHPAMKHRYDRDMMTVIKARTAPATPQGAQSDDR